MKRKCHIVCIDVKYEKSLQRNKYKGRISMRRYQDIRMQMFVAD